MRRTTMLLAGSMTAALLLPGCGAVTEAVGGDDTESYCEDLEAAQDEASRLATDGGEAPDDQDLEASVDTSRELGDAAPDEVADDWTVVNDNLDEREAVLEEAGLGWGDLASASSGDLPEGTTQEDLAAVGTRLSELNTPEFNEANENITAHAQEECGLEPPEAPEVG